MRVYHAALTEVRAYTNRRKEGGAEEKEVHRKRCTHLVSHLEE